MKVLLLTLFLMGTGAQAAPKPIRAPRLRPVEERYVLDRIQKACNNTWCAGDLVFEFSKFHCEKDSCALEFDIEMFTAFDEATGRPIATSGVHYPAKCTYGKAKTLADLVDPKKKYITNPFFAALHTCIDGYVEAIDRDADKKYKNPANTEPKTPVIVEPVIPDSPEPVPMPAEPPEAAAPTTPPNFFDSFFSN